MVDVRKQLAWSKLKVGLVISAALLVILFTVVFAGSIAGLLAPKAKLTARLENVKGLRTGAPVWLSGIEIGSVSGIRLERVGETIVTLTVEKKYLGFVKKDAEASVQTMGLLGDKYVELSPGSAEAPTIGPGDVIRGAVPVDIATAGQEFVAKTTEAVIRLERLFAKMEKGEGTVSKLINDPSLYNNLRDATRTLAELARELRDETGTYRRLVKDPALYENLNKASIGLSATLEKLNRPDGLAGKLMSDKELANDVKETAKELKGLVKDIKEHPERYFKVKVF